jgi:hypothetical protein
VHCELVFTALQLAMFWKQALLSRMKPPLQEVQVVATPEQDWQLESQESHSPVVVLVNWAEEQERQTLGSFSEQMLHRP